MKTKSKTKKTKTPTANQILSNRKLLGKYLQEVRGAMIFTQLQFVWHDIQPFNAGQTYAIQWLTDMINECKRTK
jgi:hypothetical protein